jgi:head-tail adaptor
MGVLLVSDSIDPGRMRHRVTLQVLPDVPAAGTAGDEDRPFTTVGTYWALVEPLSGRALFNAQQLTATIDYRITMRCFGPLVPGNRLIFQGTRVFNVESVIRVDERNAYYLILATLMRGEVP